MSQWPSEKRINIYLTLLLTLMLAVTARFISDNFLSNSLEARPARDFIAFWATSKLILVNQPAAAYDFGTLVSVIKQSVGYEVKLAWLYPPTLQLFVAPIALIPYKTAYALFISFSLLIYIYSSKLLIKKNSHLLGIISFPAVYLCIIYGQNSIFTAALVLFFIFYIDKKPVLAGLILGLLAVKPQMAILFPIALLAGRHWRALASAASTQIFLILVSIYFFGIETWIAFFDTSKQPVEWIQSGLLSWEGMTSLFSFSKILGSNNVTAYIIHTAFSILFLLMLWYTWRNHKDIKLRSSTLVLAALTATPYIQEYELVWLIIPLLLLTQYAMIHGWHKWQRELYILAWITPLLTWASTIPSGQQAIPLVIIAESTMLISIYINIFQPKLLRKT